MTEFKTCQAQYTALIERELPRFLPQPAEFAYERVLSAMRYSLFAGGKRVRGMLTLAFYRLFDSDVQKAMPMAAAIEMIHAYSLIHDDLPCMDDDDMRRGKPACHIAFGEATALLAGDGLLTQAFEAAAGAAADFPAPAVVRCIELLAQSAGVHGMLGGQVMDLAGEGRRLCVEELDEINSRKTGALFRAAAGMGCHLGGANSTQLEAALEYALYVGRAFQIQDDILDETADPAQLGKPVGSDADNQKSTYAALLGVARCREVIAELNQRAKAALESLPGDTAFLAALADALGGRNH